MQNVEHVGRVGRWRGKGMRSGASLRGYAVIAVIGVLFAGCSSTGSGGDAVAQPVGTSVSAAPVRGGRLVYGLEADPNGLDPTRNAFDQSALQLANALYDPIAAFDGAGSAKPYLVAGFEPNGDYTQWTFHLRPDVTFHSGARFDADAFRAFILSIRDSTVTGPPAQYIKDVSKIDALSLTIVMKKPFSTFPNLLTGQGGYVVSQTQMNDPQGQSHPDGTGPFVLRKWEVNKRFELIANPKYWRKGLPYLNVIDFEVVPDGADRVDRLGRGDLDVIAVSHADELRDLNGLTASQQARSAPDQRVNVERDPGAGEANFLAFNMAVAPFDDVRMRRAVAYATDHDALAQRNGWPTSQLMDGPFPQSSPFWASANMIHFDLAKAKELVADYQADQRRKGKSTKIQVRLTGAFDAPVLQQLVEQWGAAGITASIDLVDFKKHILLAVGGNYQVEFLRYLAAVDPDQLWHFFTSDTWAEPGRISINFARLKDPQVDKALEAGRATLDPAKRKQAYAILQERFADQVPFIWFVRSEWYVAANGHVHDAHNVTLPDDTPAMPLLTGTFRLTETWIRH
jgi:peptide/nickel transport system substrate-binding protein